MNKTVVAAAAIALPMLACAQSSVTIFGRLNLSVQSLHFKSTPTRVSSSLNALTSDASHWGMRGVEDLGGGMRAYFKLESGFQADTGTVPGAFFSREAYVGLGNSTWGSLQMGSQWAPGVWQALRADPFQRLGAGSQPYLLQGMRGYTLRYDNAIQYLSPSIGGVSGRAYYAAGEGAPTGRATAVSVDYDKAPLYASAYIERTRTTAAAVGLAGAPVASRTASIAATYDFGMLKMHGQYQMNSTERVADAEGYLLGVTVPIGVGQIRASYVHRSALNADASQLAVGYLHSLSKRTVVFTNVARLSNKGDAAFRMGPAMGEQAALGAAGPVAGQGTTGVQLGLMHSF